MHILLNPNKIVHIQNIFNPNFFFYSLYRTNKILIRILYQ